MAMARPCAIFSYLVHIIRDFQEDQLSNLNYFAEDILHKHGLTASELREIAMGAPVPDSFRGVIREYYDQALAYGLQTMEVLDRLQHELKGRYLLSLHVIYSLYKMVFDRIDPARGSFTTAELNPTPSQIKDKVLEHVAAWESKG
jgi:phytoene/squalene synthetase